MQADTASHCGAIQAELTGLDRCEEELAEGRMMPEFIGDAAERDTGNE
jgi:hypothetical protein